MSLKQENLENNQWMTELDCLDSYRGEDGLLPIVGRHVVERTIVERKGVKKSIEIEQDFMNSNSFPIVKAGSEALVPISSFKVPINFTQTDSSLKTNSTLIEAMVLPATLSAKENGVTLVSELQNSSIARSQVAHENVQLASEEKRPSAVEIACQLARCYHFGVFEGKVYVFENNHYKLCDRESLECIVYFVLKNSVLKDTGYRFFRDICNFLKLETKSKKFTMDDIAATRKYIGFKNGYLSLENFEFHEPNPEIFITNYLEVYYRPFALNLSNRSDLRVINCPYFDKFITELADGNRQIYDRIYEMIGYIISNDCSAKKLFALLGVSNSGKSKLGEFIMSLFNDEAVTSIPIGELGERFATGDLPGKALCVDLDLPATKINAKTSAKIKSLTGGDTTSAEQKFEERRSFVNRAKLLYASNHPIEISEKEYVLRDRFVSIPIMKTIPIERQLPNLLDYFKNEKILIVMKAIGYYCELVRNNYKFSGSFRLNEAFINNTCAMVITPENMIKKFVEDKCQFTDFDQWTFTDTIYEVFCDHYKASIDVIDYNNFSRLLNYIFEGKVDKGKKRRDHSSAPISIFKGIIIKTEFNE